MSDIEYNSLLFLISERLDELNVRDCLLFLCRGKIAPESETNIQNVLSLFTELEERNHLGPDRLEVMKGLLKAVREWPLFGKINQFEVKRKKYNDLLDKIILALDELNDMERLVGICREEISEESEHQIQDIRSLFKELENKNKLGIDRLDILKKILTEVEQIDLLKEVNEFEDRRNSEDESERKKAQAAAVLSSVRKGLKGVLKIETVFKVAAGGIFIYSAVELLRRWSTFEELVTAVNSCVLPAGTHLVNLAEGSVCFTVQAETLPALTALWSLYEDGTLTTRLYNFFITYILKERAGGEKVEVNVTIEKQEYEKACLELINEAQEAVVSGDGKRTRRNSDSAVYFRETEFGGRNREKMAAFFEQTPKRWKDYKAEEMEEKAEEMEEESDEQKISERLNTKLMNPEKRAYVQKFLEDIPDTYSMTTETSDSDYGTHTTASETGDASAFLDVPEDQAYDGIRNPFVLVINNSGFDRTGAFHDYNNLKRFITAVGSRFVREYFDLDKALMLHLLETTRNNEALVTHDGFICIISSHANEEDILGVDGGTIPVDVVTSMFHLDKCPQLVNKPKLFFLIGRQDDYYPSHRFEMLTSYDYYGSPFRARGFERPVTLSLDVDFLIVRSFHSRWINVRTGLSPGSLFLSLLVQVFQASSHKEDLMSMLIRVSSGMRERGSDQFPRQFSTLTKKVFFKPEY